MEWLRCEDSSNLFKTPKSVQCYQTGKLKSLIKLYYLRNFEIIYRVSVKSRRPPPPSPLGQGKGRGKGRRCANYTCKSRHWHSATRKYSYRQPLAQSAHSNFDLCI